MRSVPLRMCCSVLRGLARGRPAGTALLDNQTDVVGIPAFLPMDPGSTAGFYFVTAREAARATSNVAQSGSQASTVLSVMFAVRPEVVTPPQQLPGDAGSR